MNQRYEASLPQVTSERLDSALARWASAHALSTIQAESVRQAVLSTPDELSFAWWQNWLDQLNQMVAKPRSMDFGLSMGWANTTEEPVVNPWQISQSEFVPYLRIA